MLMDERDRTRPLLVIALTVNLFSGFFLKMLMGTEGGMLPYKYDRVLVAMDQSLGITAAALAPALQGFWRTPLIVVYQLMIPMMIAWFLVTRRRNPRASAVLAYVAELIAGPAMYAILPACGPVYLFGAQWLHPPQVEPTLVKMVGLPNAFPSLHVATALVFVLMAPGKLWRAVALVFFAGTWLATIATGEHYLIDLIAGLMFGCFAASVGYRRYKGAAVYLAIVAAWSLAVRFGFALFIAQPMLLRVFAGITAAGAVWSVIREWRVPPMPQSALAEEAS
jgi:membrane-associated phospholipid phosphatase